MEGAAFEDGRRASIFDNFAHSHSGSLPGDGEVAVDEYHKYKEDVQLMAETGLDAYRFSVSWSRLIPDGRGHVNAKGLKYYNNLINELISHGIQPHVTLIHLDVPQALEDEYGGFLDRRIIEDFTAYADVCFREFGDRVPYWTTINEANIFILGGYDFGDAPPGRCSSPFGRSCTEGNSTIEPYIAAYNALLAHASAARLYKEKYQAKQHGVIGFSLYALHFIPFSNTTEDVTATWRSYEFFLGWFMHPLMYGDYPKIMNTIVGTRLPVFTKNELELVKGSFDFIGINYYTVVMIKDNSVSLMTEPRDYLADNAATWIYINGSAPQTGDSYPNTPWGLQGVLEHFKQVYDNPPIYIYENGQRTDHSTAVTDSSRVEYLQSHIGGVLDAVRNGCNAKGYFVWSFLDLYELLNGYECGFGLYYVNFSDPNLPRYPKLSQRWYSKFLKGGNVFRISRVDVDDMNLLRLSKLLQSL